MLGMLGRRRILIGTISDVTKHRTGRTVRTGAKYRSWVLVEEFNVDSKAEYTA